MIKNTSMNKLLKNKLRKNTFDLRLHNTILSKPRQLQFLEDTNQLIIAHSEDAVEELCSCERQEVYTVYNRIVIEDTTCCGHCRQYEYVLMDRHKNQLLCFCHPTDCCACLQKLEVLIHPDELIGTVTENFAICRPSFTIRSSDNVECARVVGPYCPLCACCCSTMSFKVYHDKECVGRIGRGAQGVRSDFPKLGYVSVSFPTQMDLKNKAMILAAGILVNFIYYYRNSTRRTFWIVSVPSQDVSPSFDTYEKQSAPKNK